MELEENYPPLPLHSSSPPYRFDFFSFSTSTRATPLLPTHPRRSSSAATASPRRLSPSSSASGSPPPARSSSSSAPGSLPPPPAHRRESSLAQGQQLLLLELGRDAMAPGGRSCLLAVALVAAWISGVAAASSSPEQAGTRQKSINCLPCSRTYVAGACLDTLTGQLAQHRDLTEISDSADLCKGLVDDLDVPTLSELHRKLVGEGSHRRLVYSVKFGNCQDAMVNFLDGYDANLVIIEKLANGVFADPFELQHFVERKVFLDVAVFGDTNLELPSALSNRSAVEIHFNLRPSISMNCNLVVELPLHARYPPLDASGYAMVEFSSPDLLLRYRKKDFHSDSCLWAVKNLDAAPVEKAVWRIPCGDKAHIAFVSSITFLSALVCSMSIVLAALIY